MIIGVRSADTMQDSETQIWAWMPHTLSGTPRAGPDTPNNGMALCSFQHLAFDRGALSLNDDLRILVSKDVHGQIHVDQLLLGFSGKP